MMSEAKMWAGGQLQAEELELSEYLLKLCKQGGEEGEREIDFIALEKELARVQGIQERTCEQIVEFVDQHRERFMEINQQLGLIEDKVQRSEAILKMLASQVDDYKASCYLSESKIQRIVSDYELHRMHDQLLTAARSEAEFLLAFNSQFEAITNREVAALSLSQRYLLSRFTFKLQYLRALFDHQLLLEYVPDTQQLQDILNNIAQELQFYLSEQLAKYQALLSAARDEPIRTKLCEALGLIRVWYVNLGKQEDYYRVLEKNTIQREMQAGEKLLLAHKTALLSGKDQQLIESVFQRIFTALAQFPTDYPSERLLALLFSFFRKEELKFLYTYAMPIFPVALTSYLWAVGAARVGEQLAGQLREHHGWNLRMWVMVREKNILDRSANDTDLLKWIDIIFKQSCMLPGTLTDFLKLAFKLVNRYLDKTSKAEFTPAAFNRLVEQREKVGAMIGQKVMQNAKESAGLAGRIEKSLNESFERIIKDVLNKNLQTVAVACQNFLEPIKSFVSKIIKKDKQFLQHNTINKHQNLFKPLHTFIKNNADLSPSALAFITDSVEAIVTKHYDSRYAPQIYSYAKDQLISEQVSLVMQVVGRERTTLFKPTNEK